MRVKALQDCCVAEEGVVSRVRKYNANLMNEQGQYKAAIRTLNNELKETKGKLEGVDCQKEMLQKEVTALLEKVETVGTDTIQKFKASQSYIDSCADYYGIGFDDCLKQVVSAFTELDLSRITMDDPVLTSPVNNDVVDEADGSPESNLSPNDDCVVVLAQLATNPPHISASNAPAVFVDVENPQSQKDDGNLADAPAT